LKITGAGAASSPAAPGAGAQLGVAGAGHHLQVRPVHERDERPLRAQQGERVAEPEPEHLARPPRAAHGAREGDERLALPPLGLALGERAGVGERHGGLSGHGAQELRVVVAERRRRGRVHGEHAHEARADAHRHGEHAARRAGVAHHVVGRGERGARRVVLVDAHRRAGAGGLAHRARA
jgi:hypothetical protein